MARGPKKHLKRIAAPSHWMLDKLTGHYAPRPSTGPHKLRECIPMVVLLRNRLRYALTYNEVKLIVMQRLIEVDGKVRTDVAYPVGIMDVISIPKTGENFRLLLDTKGRFIPHQIGRDEAIYKLCKVKKITVRKDNIPSAITFDGRTITYIHPNVRANDTVRLDVKTGKVMDFLPFELGASAMVTGGHNVGRVGSVVHLERHLGGFDIVHLKDKKGSEFSTRAKNVFVIGDKEKNWISLPKQNGVRLSIHEERLKRIRE